MERDGEARGSLSDLTLPKNAQLLQGPEDREHGQGLFEQVSTEALGS